MAARQAFAIVVGVAGFVVLTREIGPSTYGRYVAGLGIVGFLTLLGRFGVEVYLIRRPEQPDARMYRTALTMMLVNGIAIAALSVLLAPVTIGPVVGEIFVRPFQVLVLALPLSLLLAPGLASLERAMRYRRVALIGLVNPLAFYAVAVPWAIGLRRCGLLSPATLLHRHPRLSRLPSSRTPRSDSPGRGLTPAECLASARPSRFWVRSAKPACL